MSDKEAYWFSHDSNSRHDEKIVALRMKHGWEGYGLYWAIIEKLRESPRYTLSTNYNVIAYDLRTNNEIIKSIITGFGLFIIDENSFYSESLINRMRVKDEKSKNGKKAALARWEKHKKNAPVMQPQCDRNADALQVQCEPNAKKGKERKEKEKKGESIRARTREEKISLSKCFNICFSDHQWHKAFQNDIREDLLTFFAKLKREDVKEKSVEDFKKHFSSWLRIEKEKKVAQKKEKEFPDFYDPKFEKILRGQRLMQYHKHLKELGWKKNAAPGGTTWSKPKKKTG